MTVTTRFHVERRSLAGGPHDRLLEQSFEPCSCATGACSETCSEAEAWAPGGVVDDFLFVKHWVPGQLGAAYGPSFLLRRAARGWQPTPIARTVEQFLAAADGGSTWIEVECDAGCCGWSNESSDRTTWVAAGRIRVLFDEWSRYHNRDYDVSFFTSHARIAPDRRHVALTIRATEPAGAERPSSEGHPDSLGLAAIRRALADLPMVEVHGTGSDSTVRRRVTHAEAIGWSSALELVILERGRLVALDVRTGRRREPDIRVRNAADAIVTRP